MAIAISYPKGTPTISDTVIGIQYEINKDPATKLFSIEDIISLFPTTTISSSYKVCSMFLSQAGASNIVTKNSGTLSKGITYTIESNSGGANFMNVGAPNNTVGTSFMANANIAPISYGTGSLSYDMGAPRAEIIENNLGDIIFAYDNTGTYNIYSDNLFTLGKTAIISGNEASFNEGGFVKNFLLQCIIDEPGRIILYTTDSANGSGGYFNSYLSNRFVEIRVYN